MCSHHRAWQFDRVVVIDDVLLQVMVVNEHKLGPCVEFFLLAFTS